MAAATTNPPHPGARKRRRLTPQQIREVAAKSYCAIRTVESYLDGGRQWSTTSARIKATLQALGLNV
jgi:hypothetical protein